jgi:hypothetical protein
MTLEQATQTHRLRVGTPDVWIDATAAIDRCPRPGRRHEGGGRDASAVRLLSGTEGLAVAEASGPSMDAVVVPSSACQPAPEPVPVARSMPQPSADTRSPDGTSRRRTASTRPRTRAREVLMPAGPHTACMPVDAALLISAASPANESRDELRRAGFTDEIDGWAPADHHLGAGRRAAGRAARPTSPARRRSPATRRARP